MVAPTVYALHWGREHHVEARRLVIVSGWQTVPRLRGLARTTPAVRPPVPSWAWVRDPDGDVHRTLLIFDSYRKAAQGAGD